MALAQSNKHRSRMFPGARSLSHAVCSLATTTALRPNGSARTAEAQDQLKDAQPDLIAARCKFHMRHIFVSSSTSTLGTRRGAAVNDRSMTNGQLGGKVPVGQVVGTVVATPLQFSVAVRPEQYLQLDDVVVTQRRLPGQPPGQVYESGGGA